MAVSIDGDRDVAASMLRYCSHDHVARSYIIAVLVEVRVHSGHYHSCHAKGVMLWVRRNAPLPNVAKVVGYIRLEVRRHRTT